MGYEIKLYAGTYTKSMDYFKVIAMVDLCVTGTQIKSWHDSNSIPVYIYGIDTNQFRKFDNYGERIKAISLSKALDILQSLENQTPYRRYEIAIAMLGVIQDTFTEPVYVALFGH